METEYKESDLRLQSSQARGADSTLEAIVMYVVLETMKTKGLSVDKERKRIRV